MPLYLNPIAMYNQCVCLWQLIAEKILKLLELSRLYLYKYFSFNNVHLHVYNIEKKVYNDINSHNIILINSNTGLSVSTAKSVNGAVISRTVEEWKVGPQLARIELMNQLDTKLIIHSSKEGTIVSKYRLWFFTVSWIWSKRCD